MRRQGTMKVISRFIVLSIICIAWLFPLSVYAEDAELEIGIGVGGAFGLNESEDNDFKPAFRAMIGTKWSEHFQTELGAGYTQNGDGEFEVNLIPIDVRMKYSPLKSETIFPYLYAGFGALYFEVTEIPEGGPPNMDVTDWTGIIPFGIGVQYYFTDQISLDVCAGDYFSFSDVLNPLNGDEDDSFLGFTVGVKYTLDSGNKDRDGDGLIDKEEKALGTDKRNPDTDGDGLLDGQEVNQTLTDPFITDSDGDGLGDGEEVNATMTDPNKTDTDGDGLSDYDELKVHMTSPLTPDSDGDGLSDSDEILTYTTDPNNADTDNDGLTDAQEINDYLTDPKLEDTDGGSIPDLEEVDRGTDPLNPDDDFKEEEMIQVEVGTPIILEGVVFNSGKADVLTESEEVLTKVLNTLVAYPEMKVRIDGYTDNTGSHKLNMRLSQSRADAIRDWLIGLGIDSARLSAVGNGPDNPVAPNDTKEGRAKNRRIEFVPID